MEDLATVAYGVATKAVMGAWGPAVTPFLNAIELRQDDETTTAAPDGTCGLVSIADGIITASCPGSSCITSGSYYGCENYNADTFVTECLDSTDPICESFATMTEGTWDYATWCCIQSPWPFCATIEKTVDGDVLTQFECFTALSGELNAVDPTTTSSSAESTSASSETSSSAPAESSGGGGGGGGGNKDGGNHTGAIVGGVVGGVALISLLGFGFWFIRYQKRKTAAKAGSAGSPGATGGSPSTYQSPGPVYHSQGYAQAPQMSPQMQQQHVPPYQPGMPYYPAQSPSQHAEYPNSGYPNSAYPNYPNQSPSPMHNMPPHHVPHGAVEVPTDNQKNPVEIG